MIKVNNLVKSFGHKKVLTGLDIEFSIGKVTAVLGPNGSGKTTLMKSILGMVLPDQGTILVDDQNIKGNCFYRNSIGYLPQIARFPENITVRELLQLIADLRRAPKSADKLIAHFELEKNLDDRLGHLSGGTRQKVNLVQALMFDTPYLLMDEPTAGLDPVSLLKLKQLIREERSAGKTILITSHIMGFVEEMADEIIYILDGQIHIKDDPSTIKEAYGASSLEGAIALILSGMPRISTTNGKSKKEEATITIQQF